MNGLAKPQLERVLENMVRLPSCSVGEQLALVVLLIASNTYHMAASTILTEATRFYACKVFKL
jgi:hypothetical protein